VQQGHPDGQLALHPAGELPAQPAAGAAEPGLLQEQLCLSAVFAAGKPVGGGREVEVLLDGQVRVQPCRGRHVPNARLWWSEHDAGAGRQEPDEHLQAGRLASAVPAHHDGDARRVNGHRDPGEDKIAPAGGVHVPQPPLKCQLDGLPLIL
jgi:hypothetical protein